MTKKKRILFGAVDIGYRIEHYSKFIKENFDDVLEAESFSKYKLPESHYKTNYTYVCDVTKESKFKVYVYTFFFFLKALFRYDIFHFLSGETILPWKLRGFELACYKLFGKKIIMHFVGSDIRSEEYLFEKNENLEAFLKGTYQMQSPISSDIQLKLIQQARKYAHSILVSTPDLLQIIPEAMYLPVFLDPENLDYEKRSKTSNITGQISILHSPSASRTKGSKYLEQIFVNLENKFGDKIKFITPQKNLNNIQGYAATRYELLSLMSEADIVIDQLLIGWYGLKAVEALSFNCTVFCFINPLLIDFVQLNDSLKAANILNLEDEITTCINEFLYKPEEPEIAIPSIHNINNYRDQLALLWS